MRTMMTAAAMMLLCALPAAAQAIDPLFAGSEVRRSQMSGSGDIRYDVWTFSPDGRYSGAFMIEHRMAAGGGYAEEGRTAGRWRIESDRLCLSEADAAGPAGETCFTLERTGGSDLWIEFVATEESSGRRWLLHVAPG